MFHLCAQDIQIIKLLKYAEYSDYLLLSSELLFILFILYYLVEESFEIHEHGWAYFSVFGNITDCVVIGQCSSILIDIRGCPYITSAAITRQGQLECLRTLT